MERQEKGGAETELEATTHRVGERTHGEGGRRTGGEEKVGTGFCLHFVLFRSRDGFF
jgi:hypothetical protein